MEKFNQDDVKAAVEFPSRRIVTGIVIRTIESAFTVGSDEQKEEIKTPIRSIVNGALTDIVEQV